MGSCFCVMEDKLTKKHVKKPKLHWAKFILDIGMSNEYLKWKLSFKRKIKSENRLAYLFLRSKFGIDWIRQARIQSKLINESVRIAHVNWLED